MWPKARLIAAGTFVALLVAPAAKAQYDAPPLTASPYSPPTIGAPPSQPLPATRPAGWPGGQPANAGILPPPIPGSPPQLGFGAEGAAMAVDPVSGALRADETKIQIENIDGVKILATVGPDAILASDVMPRALAMVEGAKGQVDPKRHGELLELAIRESLKPVIERKLVCYDARRTVTRNNKDGMARIEKSIGENFDHHEVKKLLAKHKVETAPALNEKLREMGTSLEIEKRLYIETTLMQEFFKQKVKPEADREITHEDMLTYYREHAEEFAIPAKAKWQHLLIKTGKTRTRPEAEQVLAQLGNRILAGESFEDVAKTGSESVSKDSGGVHDWTGQGSLASTELDQALFALPVGALSRILFDSQGGHIVKVLERQDASRVPFVDAQSGIKDKIKKQRTTAAVKKYVAELKSTIPIWTVYGDVFTPPAAASQAQAGAPQQR